MTTAPKPWQQTIAKYWKAIIAVAGFTLIALRALVGFGADAPWIDSVISGLVALGVLIKANQSKVEKLTGIDIDEDKAEG